MAVLVLTEKEKQDATYLDWDDDSLGKLVKKLALTIGDYMGHDAAKIAAVMSLICVNALDANAGGTITTMKDITCSGESIGDWEVTVKCLGK